jgi:hypothetical protein
MTQYIVTTKLPKNKNKNHDPRNKVVGECDTTCLMCTDSTGEHHSVLVYAPNLDVIREFFSHDHVTRIEQVDGVINLLPSRASIVTKRLIEFHL